MLRETLSNIACWFEDDRNGSQPERAEVTAKALEEVARVVRKSLADDEPTLQIACPACIAYKLRATSDGVPLTARCSACLWAGDIL